MSDIDTSPPGSHEDTIDLLHRLEQPLALVDEDGRPRLCAAAEAKDATVLAWAPALPAERLGAGSFRSLHRARSTYVVGSMALGIGSVTLVKEAASAGHLAFFGAAGLRDRSVEGAIDELRSLGDSPYGVSLVDDPFDPEAIAARVQLLIDAGVGCVEASGFLRISRELVYLRCAGLRRAADGQALPRRRIIAKVSRPELAARFFAPPPERHLRALCRAGRLTAEEVAIAATIPMAEDVTAEADSGGHTDRRPLLVLLAALLAVRDEAAPRYPSALRVGAAGGLGEPQAIAAAYGMGADYILLGSVHQACVEAGTSNAVKELLARATISDMTIAPAPDLFGVGASVQVLGAGNRYAIVARRLAQVHQRYAGLEDLPSELRAELEETIFGAPIEAIWEATVLYLRERSSAQLARVAADPKLQMGATFRWYLAKTARWARDGVPERRRDYQIWSSPAIGAFNAWVVGTPLAEPHHRQIRRVAEALLRGAAVVSRARALAHVDGWSPPLVAASRWHIEAERDVRPR